MKKDSVRIMAEVAIFATLGYVLDLLAGAYSAPIFPNGGSIGIAMVCILIIGLRRGFIPAVAVGLIMGLLDVLDGYYAIADTWYKAFMQVGLDYWLAYPLVGFAGIFKKGFNHSNNIGKRIMYIVFACLLGGGLKFLSHFLSGVIFWPGSRTGASKYIYSLTYNGSYMLPSIALTILILVILTLKYPMLIEQPVSFALEDKK